MHYKKDTNCISLKSNANIAIDYGRGSYKDKYIMVKITKKEFGEQTVEARQYMLQELYSRIQQSIVGLPQEEKSKVFEILTNIDVTNEIKDDISIAEMYKLTDGKVEYGKANGIVKNIFYLSKARRNAILLSEILKQVLGKDSKYKEVIQYIKENGFRIEPEIISRQSGKGIKLSESVSLNLSKEEQLLVDEIKKYLLKNLKLFGKMVDLQMLKIL